MAITKDLSDITIDIVAETGTVVDGSTYTSPVRADCGVFVKVYKLDYSGNRTYCTTTGNGAAGGDDNTEWEFEYASDGWYQIFYVAVPDWEVTSYARYDAVYRDSNDTVYRSKVNANSVTVEADLDNITNWEVISDPTSLCLNVGLATASANLNTITSITTYNTLLSPIILDCFNDQTGIAFTEVTSDYKRSEDVRIYELLGLALDSIDHANTALEYAQGEFIARRAISICESC